MQLQGKLERADALPNLDESNSESQVVCEQCQTSPAFLSYNRSPPSVPLKAVAAVAAFWICYEAYAVRSTKSEIRKGKLMFGEVKMKSHPIGVFFTLMVVSNLALDTGLAQTRSAKEPSKAVLMTGCLVKGDEPGEVWLAQKNGRIYSLEGEKIDLNAHLGQKVVVEGYVLPKGKEEAAEESQKEREAGKRETADLRVRMLKTISKSCTHSD